jgi:hypothetical protein
MNCAIRTGVYALLIGVTATHAIAGVSAGNRDNRSTGSATATSASNTSEATEFQWNEHSKLSWDDFRGPVMPESDETAAATHCGMGFKTVTGANGKPEIVVYNKFYVNKSWVRSDAKIDEILTHEQGHFDLCEIYTRKLRQRLSNFNLDIKDAKEALYAIYTDVSAEYESRQQAYEDETTHGIDLPQQKKWTNNIARELAHS